MVTVRSGLPSTGKRWRWTRVRSFSARTAPSSTSVSVRMSMNSSPPYRPIMSEVRRLLAMVWATPRSTTSPEACPYVSFTALKWSISTNATDSGRS